MSDTPETPPTSPPPESPASPPLPDPPLHDMHGTGAHLLAQMKGIGWVGERKALSLMIIGFFATFLFLIAMGVRTEAPEWFPAFFALLLTYAVTFFGLGADWFWGRWVATGLSYWGMTVAVMAAVTTRQLPTPLVIFGVGHVLVWLCMQGPKMAAHYEGRPEWQKRWGLDEEGVRKLRASVTRSASSVPAIILFALAPRDNAGAALAFLALSGFGLLLAGRTLGVLMLGWAGLVTVAAGAIGMMQGTAFDAGWVPYGVPLVPMGMLAGLVMIAATFPFVRPAAAYLRKLR